MNTNHEILIDLYKKGLITDEVLAVYLNEDSINKKAKKVLTEEEAREQLIQANRKRAEENRRKVAEIEKKYKDEYLTKERDKDIKKMTEFLLGVENSRGERVYSIKEIQDMDYVEMFQLYHEISSRIPMHNNASMYNRHVEMTNKSVDNVEEKPIYTPPVIDNPGFHPASDFIQEKEEEKSIFTHPVIDNPGFHTTSDLIEEPKILPDKSIDIMDDFDKEETYEEVKKNAFAEENHQAVKGVDTPTTERKEKLSKSKNKAKNKFLGAATVVASLALVTSAAGPIFGAGSYIAFRRAVKTGKWNPNGKYLNYLKDNLEWMFNKIERPKIVEEVGGKVR